MSRTRRPMLTLPQTWTPAQALAAFELVDLIRDELWALYGPAIQRALRQDRRNRNPRQLRIDQAGDEPF